MLEKKNLFRSIVSDGVRIGFRASWVRGLPDAFKAIKASWRPQTKRWLIPVSSLSPREISSRLCASLDLSDTRYCLDEASLESAIVQAVRNPKRYAFSSDLSLYIIRIKGGSALLTFNYDPHAISIVRRHDGKWMSEARAWHVKGDKVFSALERESWIRKSDMMVRAEMAENLAVALEILSGHRAGRLNVGEHAIMEVLTTVEAEEIEAEEKELDFIPAPEKLPYDKDLAQRMFVELSLMEHQKDAVFHLLDSASALLADDMGLGKTRASITAAKIAAHQGGEILAICPASLKFNWKREIESLLPNDPVVVDDMTPMRHQGAIWRITNYERLASVPSGRTWVCVIFDEAHYIKEPEAARTIEAARIAKDARRRFLLTGTPILNKEEELRTLLRIGGHPIGEFHIDKFRKLFSGRPQQRMALAERVDSWILRRTKEEVLGHLEKKHKTVWVDYDRVAYEKLMKAKDRSSMVKVGLFRKFLETAKIPAIIDSIQSTAEDDKIIVFCEYLDTVEALSDALDEAEIDHVVLTGQTSQKNRNAAVDAFQNLPHVKVFLGTTDAAGVGLNLTAANHVFFASLPWTPGLRDQAEDRACRNGQTRTVIVSNFLCPGTIDEDVVAKLSRKEHITAEIIG